MLKKLKGLIIGLRISYLWVKALDRASRGDNEKSKKLLIRIEKIGFFKNVEYCLLRGYIEYKLEYSEDSIAYLSIAMENITREKGCNSDELLYFNAYAQWLINIQEKNQSKHYSIDLNSINLNNISLAYLENYPLIIHPDWVK